MLKFLSGVATGWVAARILPPKLPETSPLSPPSMADLSMLFLNANTAVEHIKTKFNELENKDQRA